MEKPLGDAESRGFRDAARLMHIRQCESIWRDIRFRHSATIRNG